MKSIIVHYQEIALKGNNRPWFVVAAGPQYPRGDGGPRRARGACAEGRIEVVLATAPTGTGVRDRLAKVFGAGELRARGPGARSTSTRSPPRSCAISVRENPRSFRVSVRRADKRFPLTSPQIEREVGGRIKEARGWQVDLDEPELTIHVETLDPRGVLLLRQGSRRRRPAGRCRAAESRACCRAASTRRSRRGG